jgi:septum formation protein
MNQIGLEFSVIPSDVIEDFSLALPPEAFTEHWAREKAKYVAENNPDTMVIGADTIVVLDNKILGKPKNIKDSFSMLQSLSGRTHEVITGMSILNISCEIDFTFNERTLVSFNTLGDSDISYYIDNYNSLDKAGSYGIQDWFSVHVRQIEGCYFNVMGLPLSSFFSHYRSLTNCFNKP